MSVDNSVHRHRQLLCISTTGIMGCIHIWWRGSNPLPCSACGCTPTDCATAGRWFLFLEICWQLKQIYLKKYVFLSILRYWAPLVVESINKHSRGPNIVFYWQNRQNIFKTSKIQKNNGLAYLLIISKLFLLITLDFLTTAHVAQLIVFYFFNTFSSHSHKLYLNPSWYASTVFF